MARIGMRRGVGRLALAGALFLSAACGADTSVVEPDPLVSPLVGDWTATSVVLTSVANPDIAPDIVDEFGATFTLNVQPSGQYTAILLFMEQASTEIGILSVSGNVVTMQHTFPDTKSSTAAFSLQGDHLTLDGDTEFDFNQDKTPEAALGHFELVR